MTHTPAPPASSTNANAAKPRGPTRIIIVDDHAMMRAGLRSILEQSPDIEVVGEAGEGLEAIDLAQRLVPDVMLVDIAMPGLNGVEITRKIRATDKAIAVVIVSMHADERYVRAVLDLGARGYLLKTCEAGELLRAIEAVRRGRLYVTADLTHVLVNRMHGAPADQGDAPHADALTPREREVVQLIAEGHSSKDIAERLHTAVKTVESHRANAMAKLDLHSIAALTKFALREGLTQLAD